MALLQGHPYVTNLWQTKGWESKWLHNPCRTPRWGGNQSALLLALDQPDFLSHHPTNSL